MRQTNYFHQIKRKSLAQTKQTYATTSKLLYSEPKNTKTIKFSPKRSNKFYTQPQQSSYIYFDQNARNNYLKKTIEDYFQFDTPKRQDSIKINNKYTPKNGKKSYKLMHSQQTKVINKIKSLKTQLKNRRKQLKVNKQDTSCLPIIIENNVFQKRPISQYKRRQLSNSIQQLQTDTFTITQLSKNSTASIQSLQQTNRNSFYETYTKAKSTKNLIDTLKRYINSDIKLYERQLKMKKYNIPLFWNKLQYRRNKCLRQQIYEIKQAKTKEKMFMILPKPAYYALFTNNNEGLINIILSLCRQFIQIKDKIVNPKININTIYRIDEKQIIIDDWGTSALKSILNIRQLVFTSYQNPVIGSSNQWLLVPEYLSPQFIRDYSTDWNSKEIWQHSTLSHIWQLGCIILQLLILTPLWIPYSISVQDSHRFRRGLLHVKNRTLLEISSKHKLFVGTGIRKALKQTVVKNIRPQILKIVNECLKLDPRQRITPEQIIQFLKQ